VLTTFKLLHSRQLVLIEKFVGAHF
jgi:hypothetical protein